MSGVPNATTLCNDCYYSIMYTTEGISLFAGLSLVAQLIILAWIELKRVKHHPKIQWKLALSSFNFLLIIIAFCNTIFIIAFYLVYALYDFFSEAVCYITSNTAALILNVSYFLYVWGRGSPIFQVVLPKIVPWIKWYFYPYVLVQIAEAVLESTGFFYGATNPFAEPLLQWGGYVTVIGFILLQVFEVFVTYCYAKYLSDLSNGTILQADESLKILSKFGLASNAVGITWLICSMVYFCYPWSCGNSYFENAWYVFVTGSFSIFPVLYVFLQLWMKDALRRQEANSKNLVVMGGKVSSSVGNSTSKAQSMKNSKRATEELIRTD